MDKNGTEYISRPVGTNFTADGMIKSEGFNGATRQLNAQHRRKLVECARLWNGFMAGEISSFLMKEAIHPTQDFAFNKLSTIAPTIFHEAMTRSDFTNLTTYVLDRMMLDNYATFPFVYDQIAKVSRKIKDFRSVERWKTDGGERPWQVVGELEGFNRGKISTSKFTYTVAKYEGGESISWEAVINDDMEMFASLAQRLALGGGRVIELFFTNLIADANGPHASFYTSGNSNIIDTSNYAGGSVNPVLSFDNLAGALAQLMNLQTAEGRGINVTGSGVVLMVGDGMLHQIAQNIINAQLLNTSVAGGSRGGTGTSGIATTVLQIRNWIAGNIKLVFNPEIRNVVTASSGAVAAKSWWVFCPANVGRPAVEIGHLAGFDKPQLFRKAANTLSGGGSPVESMGDYDVMATEFKGMVIVGGTRMDPKMTIASNGAGS